MLLFAPLLLSLPSTPVGLRRLLARLHIGKQGKNGPLVVAFFNPSMSGPPWEIDHEY